MKTKAEKEHISDVIDRMCNHGILLDNHNKISITNKFKIGLAKNIVTLKESDMEKMTPDTAINMFDAALCVTSVEFGDQLSVEEVADYVSVLKTIENLYLT